MATISKSDEGKEVRDANGELLGLVTEIDGEQAYIDPDPDLIDGIRTLVNQGDADEDALSVHEEAIDEVTDDAIHLEESIAHSSTEEQ
jgi:hypothetical protein